MCFFIDLLLYLVVIMPELMHARKSIGLWKFHGCKYPSLRSNLACPSTSDKGDIFFLNCSLKPDKHTCLIYFRHYSQNSVRRQKLQSWKLRWIYFSVALFAFMWMCIVGSFRKCWTLEYMPTSGFETIEDKLGEKIKVVWACIVPNKLG